MLGNGAEAALRTGDWSWARAEVEKALGDELEASDRCVLLFIAVAIGAFRGEPVAGLVDDVTRLVGSSTDPQLVTSLESVIVYQAFAASRLAEVRTAGHHIAEVNTSYIAVSLALGARAALWFHDAVAAAQDLAGLDASGAHGPAIEADRATIRAGLAALDGRAGDALALYRGALRAWRDLGLLWDEALAGIDMATLLDPADPDVRTAADRSREILVRLEAAPFIERLDAAMAAGPHAGPTGLPLSGDRTRV